MDSEVHRLPSKSSSQESCGWCQMLSHIMPGCVIILLTMLVPWVFSHTAWLACSALWIGVGQRSVTVLTSNRFPCPNDTLHDVDEGFSFAVSIQRGDWRWSCRRCGLVICFQGWVRHHSCQGLSADTTFTGVFRSWSMIIWWRIMSRHSE